MSGFFGGAETATIEILPEHKRKAKIRYPDRDSIIAIDPDIPEDRQRVFFQAQASRELYWQLDGIQPGEANRDYSWKPRPGRHRLDLLGRDSKSIDSVRFQVRGSASDVNDER